MTPDQWARVEELYHAAGAQPASSRGEWLARTCGSDETMRREVESLLAQHASSDDLLEESALSHISGFGGDGDNLIGQRVGNFEILELIDEGGMGQVYRARDLTLPRDVAVKVIPAAVAHDPARRARFRQEAELLASLSHPHIAHVYAFVEDGGYSLLVMELVPGRTLAEHVARGPMPVAEALPIVREIADALDAAHEQGVVHRDLKPANVKITPDGAVKVLDFGLAAPLRRVPDVARDGGCLFGTAAYLSPERTRGESGDRRDDIWAFGCVLFEMVSGRQAYSGTTVTEILTAILEREPDWSALPATLPEGVRAMLRRCLDKDPRRRLRDIGEARVALDNVITAEQPASRTHAKALIRPLLGAVVAGALAAGAYVAWRSQSAGRAARPRIEFTLEAPPGQELSNGAPEDPVPVASPDGTRILFRTGDQPHVRWWIRAIDSASATPLDVARDALQVRWSPDSAHVTWCAGNAVWVAALGGTASKITDDCVGAGDVSWSSANTLIFRGRRGLMLAPIAGGVPTPLTTVDATGGELFHAFPSFLPDAKHYVFVVSGSNRDRVGIYLGEVGSRRLSRLVPERSRPVVIERSDHGTDLMFVQRGNLVVQQMDAVAGRLVGVPSSVATRIALGLAGFNSAYSASGGLLAYRSGGKSTDQARLQWYDRQGNQTGQLEVPPENAGGITALSLSPDEQQLLFSRFARDTNTIGIWTYDLRRRVAQRLLQDDFFSFDSPEWAPGGKSFVYASNDTGLWVIHERQVDGTDRSLVPGVPYQFAISGRFLLATPPANSPGLSLFAFDLAKGGSTPIRRYGPGQAALSPDSRWLSNAFAESGQSAIYVQSYPSGTPVRVSPRGGIDPRWSADGRELYYLDDDSWLVAIPFANGTGPKIGKPTPLFRIPIPKGGHLVPPTIGRSIYVPVANGQRFLISVPVGVPEPVRVVTNWRADSTP